MSQKIIRAALESRLSTWAAARVPALPVAFEDVPFTPSGGTYLQAYLLPATTDSADLEGVMRSYVGLFQVNIVTKAGIGRGTAEGIAEEIAALFTNNLLITKSGVNVYVRSPCSSPAPIIDDATSVLPVSFRYRADA